MANARYWHYRESYLLWVRIPSLALSKIVPPVICSYFYQRESLVSDWTLFTSSCLLRYSQSSSRLGGVNRTALATFSGVSGMGGGMGLAGRPTGLRDDSLSRFIPPSTVLMVFLSVLIMLLDTIKHHYRRTRNVLSMKLAFVINASKIIIFVT